MLPCQSFYFTYGALKSLVLLQQKFLKINALEIHLFIYLLLRKENLDNFFQCCFEISI